MKLNAYTASYEVKDPEGVYFRKEHVEHLLNIVLAILKHSDLSDDVKIHEAAIMMEDALGTDKENLLIKSEIQSASERRDERQDGDSILTDSAFELLNDSIDAVRLLYFCISQEGASQKP